MLGAFLGVTVFTLIIHNLYNMHITAVFSDLEPFPKNLNVYYKGFKLGRTVRVHPSKDFTDTHVEMILNAKNLSLPDNTTAKMKSKNKKDYIELEYPDAPSITFLKNHSIIQGKKGLNIGDYIDKQAEAGGLDEIKENESVIDVGTGAGFPGIPLANCSKANFVLVDSLNKRINFLKEVKEKINLNNI